MEVLNSSIPVFQIPATLHTGQSTAASLTINFETFKASIQVLDVHVPCHALPNYGNVCGLPVRRLATPSYIESLQREETKDGKQDSCGFCTQWRWYYSDGPVWVACGQVIVLSMMMLIIMRPPMVCH